MEAEECKMNESQLERKRWGGHRLGSKQKDLSFGCQKILMIIDGGFQGVNGRDQTLRLSVGIIRDEGTFLKKRGKDY